MSGLGKKINPTLALFQDSREAPINGVGRLSADLTINGTTKFPDFRYYGGMADSAFWKPGGYGEELHLSGSGTAPALNNGSPCLGPLDDSILFNHAQFYVAKNNDFASIATEDIVVEIIAVAVSTTDVLVSKITAAPLGWDVIWSSSQLNLRINDVSGLVGINSATLTPGCWYHAICFADRSGGGQWYVNGVASGAADNISAKSGTLVSAVPFTIGAQDTGGFPLDEHFAYVSLWKSAAWLDTHLQAAIALERFQKLTGIYPALAKGTATPVAARTGRAFDGHLDKIENDGIRKLYRVGAEWMRMCQRVDSSGKQIKGYLSETVVANLCVQSETLNTTWTPTRSSISANSIVAPNGETTADTLHEDATGANTHLLVNAGITVTSAVSYCYSVWAKKNNRNWFALSGDTPAAFSGYFDLDNGVVGTTGAGATASGIEDWGNGWFRCWIVGAPSTTTFTPWIFLAEADNDATFDGLNQDSIYLFGAQYELGVYPTSYIPTTTAARTRIADKLEYKGDDGNLGGIGSDKRGVCEYNMLLPNYDVAASLFFLSLNDGGSATQFIAPYIWASNDAYTLYMFTGAIGINDTGTKDVADNLIHQLQYLWQLEKTTTLKIDGVTDGSGTVTDIVDDLDRINVSNSNAQAGQPGGIISNLRLWNEISDLKK